MLAMPINASMTNIKVDKVNEGELCFHFPWIE